MVPWWPHGTPSLSLYICKVTIQLVTYQINYKWVGNDVNLLSVEFVVTDVPVRCWHQCRQSRPSLDNGGGHKFSDDLKVLGLRKKRKENFPSLYYKCVCVCGGGGGGGGGQPQDTNTIPTLLSMWPHLHLGKKTSFHTHTCMAGTFFTKRQTPASPMQ